MRNHTVRAKEINSNKEAELGTDTERNAKVLERVCEILKKFQGTHNFHNYTKKGSPHDKKNQRYMMSIKATHLEKEALEELYGSKIEREYLKITFLGQSFIYHQIRKMVGMTVQMVQEELGDFYLENSFCGNKMGVWLAPSQGLLLDRLNFHSYNKKENIPEKIRLDDKKIQNIEQFKKENIYKTVLEYEEKSQVFTEWIVSHNKGEFLD